MKVFIAVDNSAIAEKAFEWYFTNIHKEGNEVIIGHAAEPPHLPTYVFLAGEVAYPVEEMKAEASKAKAKIHELKQKFTNMMENHKDVSYKLDIHINDLSPGEAVVKMADKEKCDIIITGSRGLGVVRRTILGSVSGYIVHHAHVPVLVCHK
ncbi:universal stress protein Sll1388-like isoform X1 [Ciona intestinalis]